MSHFESQPVIDKHFEDLPASINETVEVYARPTKNSRIDSVAERTYDFTDAQPYLLGFAALELMVNNQHMLAGTAHGYGPMH